MLHVTKYYSAIDTSASGGGIGTIDSHVHFWKYDKQRDTWITKDMKILQQNYLPEHFSLTSKRNEVEGVIAVQADQSELETHFLVELSKTHPIIKGVVGWIDLRAENIEDRLLYFSQYPIIKGWRHIVQAELDDFLLKEDFQRGICCLAKYNYTYDILIYPKQLSAALSFVQKFPDQKLMIDHCAKPEIKNKNIDDWKLKLKEIAKHPNVYCKLSGLFTEASWKEWSPADFYPYLDIVFEAFGTDRLVYGSDWPVILLSGIYVQWKSLIEKYLENFSLEDKEKILGLNANEFYKLGLP
ncbi:MAG: amidohydrolase family protein [Chitinophagaceae bacterium]